MPDNSTAAVDPPFPKAEDAPPANDTVRRAADSAHATVDKLVDTAAPAVQRVQQGLAQAQGQLQAKAQAAGDAAGEWAESLRCTVRERPLAALGTALLLGLLVGRLTR